MHAGDEITTIEGLAERRAACIRCSRRSSNTTRSSAAICTSGQIMSAAGLLAEGARARRGGDPRGHERQHLPLRRLSEHRRRDRARSQQRATDGTVLPIGPSTRWPPPLRRCAQHPHAELLAGGTTLIDLMKLGVAATNADVIDINRAALDGHRGHAGARPGRRVGAQQPTSPPIRRSCVNSPALAQALAVRRLRVSCATWRRSAATCSQRTRCSYFRDIVSPACNKRAPRQRL